MNAWILFVASLPATALVGCVLMHITATGINLETWL